MSKVSLAKALGNFYRAFIPQSITHAVDFTQLAHKAVNSRPEYVRSDRYYASEVLSPYSCARRMAFMRAEGCYVDRQAEDPSSILRMDVGTVAHEYIQDQLLGPSGALFGNWTCASCGVAEQTDSFYPRKVYCGNQILDEERQSTEQDPEDFYVSCRDRQIYLEKRGLPIWKYKEYRLFHEELNMSGKSDAVLVNHKEWLMNNKTASWYTGEIKTVDPLTFDDLMEETLSAKKYPELAKQHPELIGKRILVPARFKLPKQYHFGQAGIYSELLKRDCDAGRIPLGREGYSGTIVVYVNTSNYAMKSFFRKNSSSLLEAAQAKIEMINHVVDQTDQTKRSTDEEEAKRVLANRDIVKKLSRSCKSRTDRGAMRCPWRLICFPYKDASKNKVEIVR